MKKETAIKLFQDQKVRVHWDNEQEKWYFSIIDVLGVLTESENPRKYWSVLKTRLNKEGSELRSILFYISFIFNAIIKTKMACKCS